MKEGLNVSLEVLGNKISSLESDLREVRDSYRNSLEIIRSQKELIINLGATLKSAQHYNNRICPVCDSREDHAEYCSIGYALKNYSDWWNKQNWL